MACRRAQYGGPLLRGNGPEGQVRGAALTPATNRAPDRARTIQRSLKSINLCVVLLDEIGKNKVLHHKLPRTLAVWTVEQDAAHRLASVRFKQFGSER